MSRPNHFGKVDNQLRIIRNHLAPERSSAETLAHTRTRHSPVLFLQGCNIVVCIVTTRYSGSTNPNAKEMSTLKSRALEKERPYFSGWGMTVLAANPPCKRRLIELSPLLRGRASHLSRYQWHHFFSWSKLYGPQGDLVLLDTNISTMAGIANRLAPVTLIP